MRTFIIQVEEEREVEDLAAKIENRVYVLQGVKDVTVQELPEQDKLQIEQGAQYGY